MEEAVGWRIVHGLLCGGYTSLPLSDTAALVVILWVLEEGRSKWLRVTTQPVNIARVEKVVNPLDDRPISIRSMQTAVA